MRATSKLLRKKIEQTVSLFSKTSAIASRGEDPVFSKFAVVITKSGDTRLPDIDSTSLTIGLRRRTIESMLNGGELLQSALRC